MAQAIREDVPTEFFGAPPAGGGSNAERDFHGEKRSNDTHASTTDPDARLYHKGAGREAKLCFMGHALMENRNGLIVGAVATRASGHAERLAALGDDCDPGFGFDMVRLAALVTEPQEPTQTGFVSTDHDAELSHLIDRFGARRVILGSLSTMVVGLLGVIFVQQLWQLILLWGIVLGIATGITPALGPSIAARW